MSLYGAIAGARAILTGAYRLVGSAGGPGKTAGFKPNETGGLWSTTDNLSGVENAAKHWRAHGAEFPDVRTPAQYVKRAIEFLNSPPRGALIRTRLNGDVVVYDPKTNTFGVRSANGAPRTMFKPDVKQHGYRTNLEYFHAQ